MPSAKKKMTWPWLCRVCHRLFGSLGGNQTYDAYSPCGCVLHSELPSDQPGAISHDPQAQTLFPLRHVQSLPIILDHEPELLACAFHADFDLGRVGMLDRVLYRLLGDAKRMNHGSLIRNRKVFLPAPHTGNPTPLFRLAGSFPEGLLQPGAIETGGEKAPGHGACR